MRWLLWISLFASVASARQITINNGAVDCFDTSPTYLMRDVTSSCGTSTMLCSTALSCFSRATGAFLGGSLATCRAQSPSASLRAQGIGPQCESLQTCADDPRQEFIREDESWKWAIRDPTADPVAHRPPGSFVPGQDGCTTPGFCGGHAVTQAFICSENSAAC